MSEVEPWVEKTIHLLQSRSQESVEELRLMLEESIRQRYGNKRLVRPIPGPNRKDDPKVTSKKKKSEAQKVSTVNPSSDSSSNDSDLAMEILEDELACVVCREISIALHNRLVECTECHSLYHQECHTPAIPDSVVADLRVVWYCSNCSKTKPKVNAPTNSSGSSSKTTASKSASSSSSTRNSKVSVGFAGKPFGGMSSSNKKSNNNAGSSSSKQPTSSKSVSPNMNIINADKRLQIMKKKAAKKQEKRLNSKC